MTVFSKKLNNKAMTLVEVLVAMVILGIVGTGIVSICISTMKASFKNSRIEYAASYARNIDEIWIWHKQNNPERQAATEGDFQTFHYSLARFIFTLEYDAMGESDPEIYIVQLVKKNGQASSDICFVIYFDSDWKQLKVPIASNATPEEGDVVESDVAYSILIKPGKAELNGGIAISGTESITIEVFTDFLDPSDTDSYDNAKSGDRLIARY